MIPMLAVVAVMEFLAAMNFVFGAESPVNDPVVFFLSQGVLGVVCWLLYKEWKEERAKREAQMQKLVDDYIPLLTRGTEAMERMADAEDRRRREMEAQRAPTPRKRT